MMRCNCGSFAINLNRDGRDDSNPTLCDVCHWRSRLSESQQRERVLREALEFYHAEAEKSCPETDKDVFDEWLHSNTSCPWDAMEHYDVYLVVWSAATSAERNRCYLLAKNAASHADAGDNYYGANMASDIAEMIIDEKCKPN